MIFQYVKKRTQTQRIEGFWEVLDSEIWWEPNGYGRDKTKVVETLNGSKSQIPQTSGCRPSREVTDRITLTFKICKMQPNTSR